MGRKRLHIHPYALGTIPQVVIHRSMHLDALGRAVVGIHRVHAASLRAETSPLREGPDKQETPSVGADEVSTAPTPVAREKEGRCAQSDREPR